MSGKVELPDRIAARLRALDLDGFGALFFDAFAPLGLLGAQVLYLAQPFFPITGESLDEWADLLQDRDQLAALVADLERGAADR